jgi:hypothetical protein
MSLQKELSDYLRRFHRKRPAKPARCRVCGGAGALRWHGTYRRTVRAYSQMWTLPIRRLLCLLCRHTFALLPPMLLKGRRYAKDLILTAVRWLKFFSCERVADHLMWRYNIYVAPLTIYHWRRLIS